MCLDALVSQSVQLCLTLDDPMDCSMLGFPAHHQLLSLLKLMCIESVMPSNHLILGCPLLHLPSIFPSIRVISNGLAIENTKLSFKVVILNYKNA